MNKKELIKHLATALMELNLEDKFKKSTGSIKSALEELETEERKIIANAHFSTPEDKQPEVFKMGLALGRIAKQKQIVEVKINSDFYYFIGTESNILSKINEYKENKAAKDASELPSGEDLLESL